jgi:hypothetical protein
MKQETLTSSRPGPANLVKDSKALPKVPLATGPAPFRSNSIDKKGISRLMLKPSASELSTLSTVTPAECQGNRRTDAKNQRWIESFADSECTSRHSILLGQR